MKRISASLLALLVLMVSLAACRHHGATFSEADALPIIVVRDVPDGFILLSEAIDLIREEDEYVDFYIWKNSAGLIDRSRRRGDARNEHAFDTSIQDTEFIVRLRRNGPIYVNWQTFVDFLDMIQIQDDYDTGTNDEHSYQAGIHQVLYALQNPDGWVILDVRSPAEFEGDPAVAAEGVSGFGRIAGAVNIEWSQSFADGGRLLPENELRELFSEVLDGRSIIVYCRSGVRSARTLAVLSSLGAEVLNFSGGWAEWSYTASSGAPPYRDLVLALTEEWTQAG